MHEFHHDHQTLVFTLEVQKQKPVNQNKFSTIAPEQHIPMLWRHCGGKQEGTSGKLEENPTHGVLHTYGGFTTCSSCSVLFLKDAELWTP